MEDHSEPQIEELRVPMSRIISCLPIMDTSSSAEGVLFRRPFLPFGMLGGHVALRFDHLFRQRMTASHDGHKEKMEHML